MTSALRGSDVIDAEFEHVDEQGHAIPPTAPTLEVHKARPCSQPVDFEDSVAAGTRRLDMFASKSSTARRRRKITFLGLAAALAFICIGGYWLVTLQEPDAVTEPPQAAFAPNPPVLEPVSDVGLDTIQTGGTIRNQSPSVFEVAPTADAPVTHRTKGSMIYVQADKKRPIAAESKPNRRPVSPAQRSQKDLTISLAGGSSGR